MMRYVVYALAGIFETHNSREGAIKSANNEFVNDPEDPIHILEVGASDLVGRSWVLEDVGVLVPSDQYVGEDIDCL